MTPQDIAPSAEGRIYSGREARARGLVDEIGGLAQAIGRARAMAKLDEKASVGVIGAKSGLLDALGGGGSGGDDEAMHAPGAEKPVDVLEKMAPALGAFAESFLPLAEEERAVVAMPFALTLR
jgi:protease-4